MSIEKSQSIAKLLALACAAALASCDGGERHPPIAEEPFNFAEVRELTRPIASLAPMPSSDAMARLREQGPRIAGLYLGALGRFEGIYGRGVGPAKGEPDYFKCKAAFHAVGRRISGLPTVKSKTNLTGLWGTLKHCRDIAKGWTGPAEMATFGNDFCTMTTGSMLVLSYIAVASETSAGREFYRQAVTLDDAENDELESIVGKRQGYCGGT